MDVELLDRIVRSTICHLGKDPADNVDLVPGLAKDLASLGVSSETIVPYMAGLTVGCGNVQTMNQERFNGLAQHICTVAQAEAVLQRAKEKGRVTEVGAVTRPSGEEERDVQRGEE